MIEALMPLLPRISRWGFGATVGQNERLSVVPELDTEEEGAFWPVGYSNIKHPSGPPFMLTLEETEVFEALRIRYLPEESDGHRSVESQALVDSIPTLELCGMYLYSLVCSSLPDLVGAQKLMEALSAPLYPVIPYLTVGASNEGALEAAYILEVRVSGGTPEMPTRGNNDPVAFETPYCLDKSKIEDWKVVNLGVELSEELVEEIRATLDQLHWLWGVGVAEHVHTLGLQRSAEENADRQRLVGARAS